MLPRPIEKLTIIGLGKSVYDYVSHVHENFEAIEGETWTVNSGAAIFRHDVLWDMHTPEWLEKRQIERALRRRKWLVNHDKPIIMPRALPEFPTSVAFPLREVIERTGSCYFSTGVSYMMAMALCCGVKQLMMWGCDFSYDRNSNSHDEQGRACCEYWVGRLVGSGCGVATSQNTHFMDSLQRSRGQIYGYDKPVQFDFPVAGGKGIFVGPDYL